MLPQSEIEFQASQFLSQRGCDFNTWADSKDFWPLDRQRIWQVACQLARQRQAVKQESKPVLSLG